MAFIGRCLSIAVVAVCAQAAAVQPAASASGAPSATSGQNPAASTVLVGDTLSTLGTVLSIDRATRNVVLRDDDGRRFAVRIGENVPNFDSLKVGDRISATFGEAVAVSPLQQGEGRPRVETKRTVQPAEAERALVREVERTSTIAEIVKIDNEGRTATLRSPEGRAFVVSLQGHEKLSTMEVGAQVVIVHVETMALTEAPSRTGTASDSPAGSSGASGKTGDTSAAAAPAAASSATAVDQDGDPGAGYSRSVERLQGAAQQLREAIQAMAGRPPGEARTQAIRQAQEALMKTQQAMGQATSSAAR